MSSIAIVGGILLDLVTYLDQTQSTDFQSTEDTLIHNRIHWYAGGTGTNLALAAVDSGFKLVNLVCKVGLDPNTGELDTPAEFVLEQLKAHGVNVIYASQSGIATGTALLIYLGSETRKIIVYNEAEATFKRDDVTEEMETVVSKSDVLFVSGYSLMDPLQAAATVHLLDIASRSHTLTVLDVVPHRIYKYLSPEQFQDVTRCVNVLISEVATIRRLFPQIQNEKDESIIADHVLERYNCAILKPTNNRQVIFSRSGLIESIHANFEKTRPSERRGFSDRLSISALYRNLDSIVADASLVK